MSTKPKADAAVNAANGHDTAASRVCFTVFEGYGQRLSKEYTLMPDGSISVNGGTQLYAGAYRVLHFDATEPAAALAAIGPELEKLRPFETIGLGVPKDGSTEGEITTKSRLVERLNQGRPTEAIPRALSHFGWPKGLALLLLDGDNIDGLRDILIKLYPPFADVAMLMRPSASASVLDPRTGKALKRGEHVYTLIDHPKQSKKCLQAIMQLAWVCGSGQSAGRLDTASDGRALVHGPIDRTVGSPERPSYEGAVTLHGLTALPRQAAVIGGTGVLCAADLLAYADQHAPHDAYIARLTAARNDPAFIARQKEVEARYDEEQIKKQVALGVPIKEARAERVRLKRKRSIGGGGGGSGVPGEERVWEELSPNHVLYRAGKPFLVSDIQNDWKAFHRTECADPIEGMNYQTTNCGWIVTNGRRIEIYSRAHGDSRAFWAPLPHRAPPEHYTKLMKQLKALHDKRQGVRS